MPSPACRWSFLTTNRRQNFMRPRNRKLGVPRSGRSLIVLVVLTCLLAAGGGLLLLSPGAPDEANQEILLHRVERSDFEAFVTEPGDVASSSNVDVRCQVKSRGSAGTAIVRICDEGTEVKEGDFLVQFDDSVLQNELIAQKIVVANDKSDLIQAESDLANAQRTLREYVEGLFEQQTELLESDVFVAEEDLRKKDLMLASSRRLASRGLTSLLQVKAAEFAVEKSKKDVAAANRALAVYRDFTREKLVGEYEANIKKQEAVQEAARFTLDLSQQKKLEIEEQIGHCLIVAPAAGQVVYNNERDRGQPLVIEEGAIIRDNQVIIRLPDIHNMQVDVKINESHVNRVKVGQPARIILDADPDNQLVGEVKTVAPFPFPMRWHGAPLEYGVEVRIIDPPPSIRPGLRAKVQIFFESQADVLQVPLASVIVHNAQHYCLIKEADGWRPQKVSIGPNNNNLVVVHEGLAIGDQVALTPFRHIDRSDLPVGKSVTEGNEAEADQLTVSDRNSPAAKPGL